MAQATHAAFLFALKHPHITDKWMRDSQYLIVVSVPDEETLTALSVCAAACDLPQVTWREPDLDGSLTAVALAPGDLARRICSNLPLAGRALTGATT